MYDGVVGQDEPFDLVHAVGALLIDLDIPCVQICLVAVRRDAQGVNQSFARQLIIHRPIGNTTTYAVPNGAAQLLPMRSMGYGVDDALVVTEFFGQKGMPDARCRLGLNSQ